jgi:hypothetical protein
MSLRGFSRSCLRYYRTKQPPDIPLLETQESLPVKRPRRPKLKDSTDQEQVPVSGLEGLGLLNHPASPTKPIKQKSTPEEKWTPDTSNGNCDLPPSSEWRRHFVLTQHSIRERVCVRDPITADATAESFVPSTSHGKVVIEAFPGLSTFYNFGDFSFYSRSWRLDEVVA